MKKNVFPFLANIVHRSLGKGGSSLVLSPYFLGMLAGPLVCSTCEGNRKCLNFMPGWVLSGKNQFFSVLPKLQFLIFLSIHEFILTFL